MPVVVSIILVWLYSFLVPCLYRFLSLSGVAISCANPIFHVTNVMQNLGLTWEIPTLHCEPCSYCETVAWLAFCRWRIISHLPIKKVLGDWNFLCLSQIPLHWCRMECGMNTGSSTLVGNFHVNTRFHVGWNLGYGKFQHLHYSCCLCWKHHCIVEYLELAGDQGLVGHTLNSVCLCWKCQELAGPHHHGNLIIRVQAPLLRCIAIPTNRIACHNMWC